MADGTEQPAEAGHILAWLLERYGPQIGKLAISNGDPADELVEVSDDEAREMWADFRARTCEHCGAAHARACPRVRRLEFHSNGNLASVEFWRDGTWPDDGLVWPEDLPPDPDEP